MPKGVLPNPHPIVAFAFRKLDKLRQAMIEFVKQRGRDFMALLSVDLGLSVGIGLELGIPPSVSLNIERTVNIGLNAE